jgi:hypothetical protein
MFSTGALNPEILGDESLRTANAVLGRPEYFCAETISTNPTIGVGRQYFRVEATRD